SFFMIKIPLKIKRYYNYCYKSSNQATSWLLFAC
ncbi:MAG: hypothetical protein ACI9QV_001329, partial [Methylophagaceae bacterium]